MNAIDILVAAASLDGLAAATRAPCAVAGTDWSTGLHGTCDLYATDTTRAHTLLDWLGAEHSNCAERVLPRGIRVRVIKARDNSAGNTTNVGLGVLGALARAGAEATELITESSSGRGTVQGTIRVKTDRALGDMFPVLAGLLGEPVTSGSYAEWNSSGTVIRVYDTAACILA